jgi:hypothetical protein
MILNGSRMTDKGLQISYHIIYPWLIFLCNTMALRDEVGSMSKMPQFHYSLANGERNQRMSFIDPGVYTSNRKFRLLLCNKLSDRSQTALRLSQHQTLTMFLRSCITTFKLVRTLDWFPVMISRWCCEVSLPDKRKENLVKTALDYRPWPPPTHSTAFCTSYSRSKVNRKERSPQLMDRWEKLNFDGVYPLINRPCVILLAFGGHLRQNTRVMNLGCQLLTKEK